MSFEFDRASKHGMRVRVRLGARVRGGAGRSIRRQFDVKDPFEPAASSPVVLNVNHSYTCSYSYSYSEFENPTSLGEFGRYR